MQNGDENDVAKDPAGYLGNFHRIKQPTEPISELDFINVFSEDNKMQKIMNLIRFIDKDKNGFITTSEMTDILKETYPAKLKDKEFKHLYKPFCSIQNPILLDYKRFREFILHYAT